MTYESPAQTLVPAGTVVTTSAVESGRVKTLASEWATADSSGEQPCASLLERALDIEAHPTRARMVRLTKSFMAVLPKANPSRSQVRIRPALYFGVARRLSRSAAARMYSARDVMYVAGGQGMEIQPK